MRPFWPINGYINFRVIGMQGYNVVLRSGRNDRGPSVKKETEQQHAAFKIYTIYLEVLKKIFDVLDEKLCILRLIYTLGAIPSREGVPSQVQVRQVCGAAPDQGGEQELTGHLREIRSGDWKAEKSGDQVSW